jgi:hypothetical protein
MDMQSAKGTGRHSHQFLARDSKLLAHFHSRHFTIRLPGVTNLQVAANNGLRRIKFCDSSILPATRVTDKALIVHRHQFGFDEAVIGERFQFEERFAIEGLPSNPDRDHGFDRRARGGSTQLLGRIVMPRRSVGRRQELVRSRHADRKNQCGGESNFSHEPETVHQLRRVGECYRAIVPSCSWGMAQRVERGDVFARAKKGKKKLAGAEVL